MIFVTGSKTLLGSSLVRTLKKSQASFLEDHDPFPPSSAGNIDVVFHFAESPAGASHNEIMYRNYSYPKQLFRQVVDMGCKKLVVASSAAIYGNRSMPVLENSEPQPLTEYAQSKLKLEEMALSFGSLFSMNVVVLRLSNLYGPGDEEQGDRASIVYRIISNLKQNKRPVLPKNANNAQDWLHVDDVQGTLLKAAAYKNSDIFNVGTGQSVSYLDMVSCACGLLNIPSDSPLRTPQFDESQDDQPQVQLDITKAHRALGHSPHFDIYTGMRQYITYLAKLESQH